MNILRTDYYLDGGTMVAYTDKGDFYVDHRINTQTPSEIYDCHPNEDGAQIVDDETKIELIAALRGCNSSIINGYLENIPAPTSAPTSVPIIKRVR